MTTRKHPAKAVNRTMKFLRINSLLALALVAGAACGGDDPGPIGPPLNPEFKSATVAANPVNTISAAVDIIAEDYESAFLRYWRPGESPQRTPAYEFDGDTLITAAALGLRFNSTYSIEVNLEVGGAEEAVDTLSFSTGARPAWIPMAGTSGSGATAGLLALSYPGGPVIINNAGRVVWYVESAEPILNSFQAHPNGMYTLNNAVDTVAGFRVLNELGQQVRRLTCVNRPTRFHEVRVQPDGDYWIMCNDTRVLDLTSLGGMPDVSTVWTVIQHVSEAGAVLFEWDSFDHFDITDNPLSNLANTTSINVTHGNALAVAPDGSLFVSFRELDEITKIDAATGQVLWRFGGLANQMTIQGDPKGSFQRQHGLVLVDNGDIQLLDNSDLAPSRLLRYRIDEQALTATLVMEFIDAPTTHTLVGGSTQAYGNGNGLVSFGRVGRVVETTPSGVRTWELTGIDSIYVFRAQRVASLYSSRLGDAVP